MAVADRGVPLSTLCPKYLHTNSTSHTWPFSAIAELIDNAYDPDVNAQHFWIDKTVVSKEECLSFMDDGNGLDYQTMHKMLSFGYSEKVALKGVQPIGIYGNGFKSGSMRLGKDAIVFSKSKTAMCIGMLSQSYLQQIGAEQIIVPIVCFEQKQKTICVKDEHKASLQDILRYSPFRKESDLLNEINAIGPSWSGSKTGTRIIIWNLRRTSQNSLEIDFDLDRYDIRMPSDIYLEMTDISHIPSSLFSLRAYCSILYLKPRLQIMIRGKKVKSRLIAKSLAHSRKDHYRPAFVNKRIPIIFGYNTTSKDQYGIMMYHKNRLIKAYERVGCQLKADRKGVGVIGVIECNFLDPTHNKQSFEENDKYRKTMTNLGIKLEEYWKEIRYRRSKEDPTGLPVEDTIKHPDQNWVQCDDCSQWRKLPDGIDMSKLPDKWYCYLNPDPQFRSCQVEEEPEDSDDEEPSYCKTYKQQEREERREQERRLEAEKELRQQQQMAQMHRRLLKQIQEKEANSSSVPVTPKSRKYRDSIQGGSPLTPSSISQAACSPSTSNGLPVISNVCSLASMLREKRQQSNNSPATAPKRPKLSHDASPQNSPSIPIDDDSDTDDDLVIVEGASTPKPKTNQPLVKVKTEEEIEVNMLLECSDDAAVDNPPETAQSESSAKDNRASAAPHAVASSTTQTDASKINIKKEKTGGESTDKSKNVNNQAESMFKIRVVKEEDIYTEPEHNGIDQAGNDTENSSDDDKDDDDVSGSRSPSVLPSYVPERQIRVDQVSEARQETDSPIEQAQQLQSQPDASRVEIKNEEDLIRSHQPDKERQDPLDYKTMFENARTKINELIKDKETLLAAAEVKSSTNQGDDKTMDEIALQVDRLMRELDKRNKERDTLLTQLESAEEEKAHLASECESLRSNLQQIKEKAAACKAVDTSVQTDSQDNESTPEPSSSNSLIALRHSVGRLLAAHHVPALDLDQVNYECNVIDEILEQVLDDGSEKNANPPSATSNES